MSSTLILKYASEIRFGTREVKVTHETLNTSEQNTPSSPPKALWILFRRRLPFLTKMAKVVRVTLEA